MKIYINDQHVCDKDFEWLTTEVDAPSLWGVLDDSEVSGYVGEKHPNCISFDGHKINIMVEE